MANDRLSRRAALLATGMMAAVAAPAAAQTAAATSPPATATDVVRPLGTVAPNWRRIRSFSGDVHANWRRIRSFGGTVTPVLGGLDPFWGSQTFTAADGAPNTPDWAALSAVQGSLSARWRRIRSFWDGIGAYRDAPGSYAALNQDLSGLVAQSEAAFGAAVRARTGGTFRDAFASPLLKRFGIDLANPASLASLSPDAREEFFMTWFDNLMEFSGADQVDHWMMGANWTPALTQTLGTGRDARIGILDFTLTGSDARNVVSAGGISSYTNGHGSAVASLIVAPHDGRGVMGIAPNASVIAFNPFDASGTADWADVTNGVLMLTQNGASIVNMSLGVPGWTLHSGWNDVFRNKEIEKAAEKTVFVIAAGNDGLTQQANLLWDTNKTPPFIVVGSVDPQNNISSFSNRPGTVCLFHKENKCRDDGDYLMDRFIVAPGEFILVSDGQGGVTRASGTSFAAPLVSGTIALIHDRWPWLAEQPDDTVGIVLRSARDLGAPGTDPVYGVGMLDVEAALSPLDFNDLKWHANRNGKMSSESADKIRGKPEFGRATWEADGLYFYVFEDTGKSFRDFAVPLSTRLVGQHVTTKKLQEQFNTYLQSRFIDWFERGRTGSLTDVASFREGNDGSGEVRVGFSAAPKPRRHGFRGGGDGSVDMALRLRSPTDRWALQLGSGEGAPALGGSGFARASDHQAETGGVNPILGFASGAGYARFDSRLGSRLTLTTGLAANAAERDLRDMTPEERSFFASVDDYRAEAGQVALSLEAASGLRLGASYTRLRERDALLGMQSAEEGDLGDGSRTNAVSMSADFDLAAGLTLSGSATVGRTSTGGADQAIRVGDGAMMSTAFQAGLAKRGLFGRADRLRLAVSQPLHVERGTLSFTSLRVIDRSTGELGEITESFDLPSAERRLVGDLLHASPVLDGAGEFSLFGRARLRGDGAANEAEALAGARVRLSF